MKLSEVKEGQTVRILQMRLSEGEKERLLALGFSCGARVRLLKRLKKTALFAVERTRVAISVSLLHAIEATDV